MRRKSTRGAQKSPAEKPVKEEVTPKTRRSRRRKRSPSSDSEDEALAKLVPVETPDTTIKSQTPPDEETSEEPVWKVTPTEDSSKGEIQKLKICLTRPAPDSPEKNRSRRKTEDEAVEEKTVKRTRSQGSSQEDELEEKKGKGKSKGKHKSKIEKSPHLSEPVVQTNNEISENVQVTPQSPSNDNRVDNESNSKGDNLQSVDETVHEREECSTDANTRSPVLATDDTENKESQATVIEDETSKCSENVIEPEQNLETSQLQTTVQEPVISENDDSEPNTEKLTSVEETEQVGSKDSEEHTIDNNLNKNVPEVLHEEETKIPQKDENITSNNVGAENFIEEENVVQQNDEKIEDVINEKAEAENKSNEKNKEETSQEDPVIEEKKEETKKSAPRHKLKRNSSYMDSNSTKQEDMEEITVIRPSSIKRVWRTSLPTVVTVDLESLQEVFTSIEFPEEPDLTMEIEKERRRSSHDSSAPGFERRVSLEYKLDSEKTSVNSVSNENEDNSNIIAFNRKISIVDDTASKLRPPPSPAKNSVTNILYITNLVRPFTVKQLKELLERTGKIEEDGFWTDRIKSKCYVQYTTQEEAEVTRNALHGVQWPIGNGKHLIIDYGTEEDVLKAKNPPAPPPPVAELDTQMVLKENVEPENKRKVEEKSSRGMERKKDGPVREWDIGKEDIRRDRSRSREKSRKHRRTPTPGEDFISRKQRKTEDAVPQKLMDDLFLKTKATPSIYWQPLSPEEIAMKQQQRLLRMEEHKRRMEESSRIKGREMGRGAFRRRYD